MWLIRYTRNYEPVDDVLDVNILVASALLPDEYDLHGTSIRFTNRL